MLPLLLFPGPSLAAGVSFAIGAELTFTRTDAGIRPGFGVDLAAAVGGSFGATPTIGAVVHRRWLDDEHRCWMLGGRVGGAYDFYQGPFNYTMALVEAEAGVRLSRARPRTLYLGGHARFFFAFGLGFDLEPTEGLPHLTGYGALEVPIPPPMIYEGRPFRSGRGALLPRAVHAAGASVEWVRAGREELASVSAFLRLAAELRALGAPAALVDRARAAAREELGHAAACFRLAGGAIAKLPPALPRRYRDAEEARRTVGTEAYLDGWGNENAAADRAEDRRERATDDDAIAVLARIAAEERGHARLGLDVARWCEVLT